MERSAYIAKQERENNPLRTYEITWADGRRERLEATKVQLPVGGNGVMFWGPDGNGWAGRLLLSGVLGAGIVAVRDVDAGIETVSESRPSARWRGSLGKRRSR